MEPHSPRYKHTISKVASGYNTGHCEWRTLPSLHTCLLESAIFAPELLSYFNLASVCGAGEEVSLNYPTDAGILKQEDDLPQTDIHTTSICHHGRTFSSNNSISLSILYSLPQSMFIRM